MNGIALAICAACVIAAAAPARAADAPLPKSTASAPQGFDSMNYFILEESRQATGTRGLTYINLIGGLDSKRFWVYYEGKILGLARAHSPRRLRVLLKDHQKIVARVEVMDLQRLRGTFAVTRRVIVDCDVTMREVDSVDARIEP